MNSDTQLTLLVLGIPIAGLIYCGLCIGALAFFPVMREHPLIVGTIFIIVPFTIAASIWIRASAKAYKK